MMLASVRARLTLWHTVVMAVLLVLFALGAYLFVAGASRARTDATVRDGVAELQGQLLDQRGESPSMRAAAAEVLDELRSRTLALVVYDPHGHVIAASVPRARPADDDDEPEPPFDPARLGRLVVTKPIVGTRVVTVADPEGGYRAALAPIRMADGAYIVAAAASLHDDEETLETARLAMLVAIPVTLLLAAVGGSLLARRSLAPMVTMREQAARIGATNLGDRLPIANAGDEVGRLAAVVNELLARLERAFAQQRQFMADASHELRTPVAVVQHESTLALSRSARDAKEYEEALRVIRDAGRRMRRIVDDLFLLARADAGELPVQREPLYLNDLVSDCARDVRSLAAARGVGLTLESLAEAPFRGDEVLLHRLVVNLLDNAIKFSPAGAEVRVRLDRADAVYRLGVEDTGPGVPLDVQPRIFERFVRADAARGHDGDSLTSGAGLGLAIARWIAEAHGGRLSLARSGPNGSLFVLELPVPCEDLATERTEST